MDNAGEKELNAKLEEAKRILLPIPGVLSVAWGYKEKAGSVTQELCFIVMVREKKPRGSLSQAETVPSQVLGLPTDVIPMPRLRKLACELLDRFDPVVGGATISTLKVYQTNHSMSGESVGTLGFFATNSSGQRDNVVLLSNNHVLAENGAAINDVVYQPRLTGGDNFYNLDPADMHPIGKIENLGMQGNRNYAYPGESAGSMYVDCATAHVNTSFSSCCHTNCGIKFANVLHNLGLSDLNSGEVAGVARVQNSNLPSGGTYPVYKVGRRTGWTKGKIRTTNAQITDPDDSSIHYDHVMIIDDLGPNCGGGAHFAESGDSGAVIVNSQRQIIALLFADAPDAGFYVACHIHPVSDLLGITMVSAQNTAGASGGATALEAALALEEDPADVQRALFLREEVLKTPRGREYRFLIEKHLQEAIHLVNHVRPVTVAWHRLHGPDFLGHVLHASRHADYAVPREVKGIARDEALRRMLEVLHHHGNGQLRADIETHAEQVMNLFHSVDNLESLAELVNAHSEGVYSR